MVLSIDIDTGADRENHAGATCILEGLVDLTVDLEMFEPNTYGVSRNLYVVRVDPDGDLCVCEFDDDHRPQTNVTIAIPQSAIRRIYVPFGGAL